MKSKKITPGNYFATVSAIGFENLPLVLKQSHTVIMTKTDNGRDWSKYQSDADLKRMINLAFKKLEEFLTINKQERMDGLEGIAGKSKKEKPYSKIVKEVQFIDRFLAFHDKIIYKNTFGIFIDDLQKAIQEKKITKKSPVAKDITDIQNAVINAFNTMYNAKHFVLKPETIKRLKGIIEKYDNSYDDIDQEYVKVKKKPVALEGIEQKESKIMNSVDFANLEFNSIGFTGKWLDFIGDPAPGFTAMVFGMPKMGKSYLCVDFAGYLARNHGKVLYVAKEEKLDATLQKKLKDKEVAHENLFVADSLPKDLSTYEFVFLDSVNKLGLTPKDLEKLKAENKGRSFIYVFQATKGGKFKGNNEFQHDVDVVIEVPEQGKAVQFGRFNQGGEMNIFPDSSADLTLPENVSMLAGIKKKPMKNHDWTTPQHLSKSDHKDLEEVLHLYKAGKLNEAMKYASDLDTIVREEIPGDIWKEMGGKLTKTGEEKLKHKKSEKVNQDWDRFDNRKDDLNPKFMFSLTASQLLSEALKGEFDTNYLIRQELANRGQDENGIWVGFDKAKAIHKIRK